MLKGDWSSHELDLSLYPNQEVQYVFFFKEIFFLDFLFWYSGYISAPLMLKGDSSSHELMLHSVPLPRGAMSIFFVLCFFFFSQKLPIFFLFVV